MKTKETSCTKCGGNCNPSKAFLNTLISLNNFGGDAGQRGTTQSRQGKAELVDCMKCEDCGHSFIPKETSNKVTCNQCGKQKVGSIEGICEHCGKFGNIKSTREQALGYWKFLPSSEKLRLWREYQKTTFTPSHSPDELTGREIEEIFRKEIGDLKLHEGEIVDKSYPKEFQDAYLKPNQKQFKKFDESLFKAYIDKFSNEDKLKALKVLIKTIPDNLLFKDNSIPLSKRY